MLERWIMAGQSPDTFWNASPAEIHVVLMAAVRREELRSKARRTDIHALAALVTLGHHKPKRFPSQRDFLGEKRRGSTDAEIKAFVLHRLKKQNRTG